MPSAGGELNSIPTIFHDHTANPELNGDTYSGPTYWKLPAFGYPTGQTKYVAPALCPAAWSLRDLCPSCAMSATSRYLSVAHIVLRELAMLPDAHPQHSFSALQPCDEDWARHTGSRTCSTCARTITPRTCTTRWSLSSHGTAGR
eukprot:768957-Prymnesium_polylepis.2